MTLHDELTLDRSAATTADPAISGVKTILLHVQRDKSFKSRLESALSLARSAGAHLSCLHVTPIEAYVAFDGLGGVFVMNDVIKALDEEEQALRTEIENDLRNEDVSWDYEQVTGNVTNTIVSRAMLADLVVTGREPHTNDFQGPAIGLLGDLLYRTRTPLFVAGDDAAPLDPNGVALIAWNGTPEAANAVRSAVGLLKLASEVSVLNIVENAESQFPSTRLLEYLSRHGIHAQLTLTPPLEDDDVTGLFSFGILEHALSIDAAYIVMGGYSHSRLGEYVFGGVTRAMLGFCPIPLLIAH